jgi:hypothetical protein
VHAEVEDDFHHFALYLTHAGGRVTEVNGVAYRFPWTTCPGAVWVLDRFVGLPLTGRSADVARVVPASEQCTHLFDLACFAVVHAANGRVARHYDVEIPDREDGTTVAKVWRDGQLALAWTVEGLTVTAPAPYGGRELGGASFLRWATSELDEDTAEAAIVLRRACFVSGVRQHPLQSRASEHATSMVGTCHTFQPGRIEVAIRTQGTTRDFTQEAPVLAPISEKDGGHDAGG